MQCLPLEMARSRLGFNNHTVGLPTMKEMRTRSLIRL
jgi:hypothetical protein